MRATIFLTLCFSLILTACGGDDDSGDNDTGDGPSEDPVTFGDVIEQFAPAICQRSSECACDGDSSDDDNQACADSWIDSFCCSGEGCVDCESTAPFGQAAIDACIDDTATITCVAPELPRSCVDILYYNIELVCGE